MVVAVAVVVGLFKAKVVWAIGAALAAVVAQALTVGAVALAVPKANLLQVLVVMVFRGNPVLPPLAVPGVPLHLYPKHKLHPLLVALAGGEVLVVLGANLQSFLNRTLRVAVVVGRVATL